MRLLLFLLLLLSTGTFADPKSHYMIHCMGCHLTDGSGMPPDVPAFNEELGVIASTDTGRAYLIRVPGAAQALISDQDLAEVVNWMLLKYSEATLPADFKPFTGSEVTRYRKDTLEDPVRFRQTLPGIGS